MGSKYFFFLILVCLLGCKSKKEVVTTQGGGALIEVVTNDDGTQTATYMEGEEIIVYTPDTIYKDNGQPRSITYKKTTKRTTTKDHKKNTITTTRAKHSQTIKETTTKKGGFDKFLSLAYLCGLCVLFLSIYKLIK